MQRIRALDGLRGVAILLVVIYHAWPNVVPGGPYGVTVFFVLSGYLITCVVMRDNSFRSFYWNRAIRLLPALVVVLIAAWLLLGRFNWVPLIYSANWTTIYSGADLTGLWHTWSLSVEEQFYFVWPAFVWAVPRRHLQRTTVLLIVVAVLWRCWLSVNGAPYVRIMWGTDTVAYALLVGSLLATIKPKRVSSVVASAALSLIIALAWLVPAESSLFVWGELLVVVAAAVVISAAVSVNIRWLETRWLVSLGLVSYGFYLWHALLLEFLPVIPALIVSLAVTVASWTLVERPVSRWRLRSADKSSVPLGPQLMASGG